jgi:hypothetical protein
VGASRPDVIDASLAFARYVATADDAAATVSDQGLTAQLAPFGGAIEVVVRHQPQESFRPAHPDNATNRWSSPCQGAGIEDWIFPYC